MLLGEPAKSSKALDKHIDQTISAWDTVFVNTRLQPLSILLSERFQGNLSEGVEMCMALQLSNSERLILDVRNQRLEVRRDSGRPVEFTLFFDTQEIAMGIFSGEISPIEAFMQGKFRSDGHLVMAFVTLQLFTGPVQPS